MSITTYSELLTAVASWAKRSDLTSILPDMVVLAEDKFNRRLRVRQQEMALSPTAISATYEVTIPANTVGVKTIWLDGYEASPLKPQTLEFVISQQVGSLAKAYAWGASSFVFDGTGTAEGVLYRNIPPLATNSTNWLLTACPSLYLFATLAETWLYVLDEQRGLSYTQRADALIEELNGNNTRDTTSGPMVARAR